jgi:hypothetical protein
MKSVFVDQDIFDNPYGYDPFIVDTPPLNAVGIETGEEVPGQKPIHQITGDDLDYLEARGIRRLARKKKRKERRAKRAAKKGKTKKAARLRKKAAKITKKVSKRKAKVQKKAAKKTKRITRRATKAIKRGKTARARKLRAKIKKVAARTKVKTATTRKAAKTARKAAKPIKKQFRKARRAATKQAAKKIGLSPGRAAYLSLLGINAWGLAKMFAGMKAKNSPDYKKARDKFEQLGGKGNEFDKYVEKGKNKKALKLPLTKLIQRKLSAEGYKDEYLGVVAEATIVAAAGIVVAILNAIGKKPKDMDGEAVDELKENALPEDEIDNLVTEEEEAGTLDYSDDPELQGGNLVWWIVGGILVAGIITTALYFVFKKKK